MSFSFSLRPAWIIFWLYQSPDAFFWVALLAFYHKTVFFVLEQKSAIKTLRNILRHLNV
jgi:hypothetical protein